MVPNKWMTLIYKAYILYDCRVHMFGDSNQCEPVEKGSQIKYDYLEPRTIREMCPKIETLKYIEKSCRYDKETHEMLKTFLKCGKVSKYFKPIDRKVYKNICYLNSTRKRVNKECCEQFTKGKSYETVEFICENEKESYKVCQDMPILAAKNIKELHIFNNMKFKIQEIKKDKF